MRKQLLIAAGLLMFILQSCSKKDAPPQPEPPLPTGTGLYILNEGLWHANNSTLTYYDLQTKKATPDYFNLVNKRGLGDTGNDIAIYGSKLYIVMNESGTLEIVDAYKGTSLKQIPLKDAQGKNLEPRYVAFDKGKAYITTYADKVVIVDTTSLTITGQFDCGKDPEGIAIVNNKIYIANTNGKSYPQPMDSTVSVFDLNTLKEIKRITVGLNPYRLQADADGDVYVTCRGDYSPQHPAFVVALDTKQDVVKTKFNDLRAINMTIYKDKAYLYGTAYNSTGGSGDVDYNVYVLDVKQEKVLTDAFITDRTFIRQFYGINVNPSNGDVYVCDAISYTSAGSKVYCFDPATGKKKFDITLNDLAPLPNGIVFLK